MSLLCGRLKYVQAGHAGVHSWLGSCFQDLQSPSRAQRNVLGSRPFEHHGYQQSDASDMLAHPTHDAVGQDVVTKDAIALQLRLALCLQSVTTDQ
jgi:hypothetical protein